jgi:hypothetical protein
MIDPYLTVDIEGAELTYDYLISDDDSGGGIFGLDSELTYKAPQSGAYFLNVSGSYGSNIGGYILSVTETYEGAPTPSAPLPTPTPIPTEYGNMQMFESAGYPTFKIQYPTEWRSLYVPDDFAQVCNNEGIDCIADPYGAMILMILQENLKEAGLASISQEEYVDLYLDNVVSQLPGYKFIDRKQFVNNQRLSYDVVHFSAQNGLFEAWRLLYLDEETDIGFNASYLLTTPVGAPDSEEIAAELEEYNNKMLAAIRYSLSTLEVEK